MILEKTISTAFMIIVSVVCAVLVFNAVYPAIGESSYAMANMARRVDDRLQSQIEIIHAARHGVDLNKAFVWVKNIGSLRIRPIERCDVFFGPVGDFERIPHEDYAGGSEPYWNYEVKGSDSEWKPTATLQITVTYTDTITISGTLFVKVIIPNGISDEDYFSVE